MYFVNIEDTIVVGDDYASTEEEAKKEAAIVLKERLERYLAGDLSRVMFLVEEDN